MCHCCVSSSPGSLVPARVLLWNTGYQGNMQSSYVLDSRLCGKDTLGLARQGKGRLLHSAKMLLLSRE